MSCDLDWFPQLPPRWPIVPLKAVCDYRVSNVDKVPADDELPVRLCNYTDVYNNEFIRLSMALMQTTATQAELDRFGLLVGDVVITKDSETWSDIGVPAVVAESAPDLVCGYHLAMLRPRSGLIEGRFLLRCLQARPMQFQFERSATGVTRYGLALDAIGRLYLPQPPVRLQRVIAAYLDRETAKIDEMVSAKQQLLEILAEKRRALITQAVVGGLDPNAPTHNVGIEWLGKAPAHWLLRRLAYQFRERDERNAPNLPLLEVSVNHGVIRREFSTDKIEGTAADFNTYKVARRGDIVFNKMRMWQGAVGAAPMDGLVSPDYVVAEPIGQLSSAFAALLFRIPAFSAECGRRSYGLVWDRLRLYWDGFRDICVAIPPRAEQDAIVQSVTDRCARMDAFQTEMRRSIELLRERRSALIAAAVTGQIDVEAAA